MLKYIVLGLLGAIVASMVYVRLAPSNPEELNKSFYPFPPGERQLAGDFKVVREVTDPTSTLEALDAIIMATPRTIRLAGSVQDKMITYETRSALWGFPDYTTISVGPDDTVEGDYADLLKIHGRLRFGQADLGVNRARIEGWLTQLADVNTNLVVQP